MLAATDPALPWGLSVPWPAPGGAASPRRAAGATVVVCDGEALLFVEAGGRSLVSFGSMQDPDLCRRATVALREHRGALALPALRVERLDGVPAGSSPLCPALVAAGWIRDKDGMVLPAVL